MQIYAKHFFIVVVAVVIVVLYESLYDKYSFWYIHSIKMTCRRVKNKK